MADETTTSPVDGEDTAAATPDIETEVEAEEIEQELDDNGEPIEAAPEDEEIELDDLKLKVPKDQAQKVREALLRQADYTKKTQEVAEQRKAFDAERQAFQQSTNEELGAAARVLQFGEQIAAFNQVDWDAWEQQDPDAANSGWRKFQQTKDAHRDALGQLQHLRGQRTQKAQQETATRREQTKTALAKDIPGWSEDLKGKVTEFGASKYGFTADELADIEIDPRIARILHDAYTGSEAAKKTQKAQGHVAAQTAKPAAKIGGAAPPATGLADNLGPDEWMRRRNAQLAKKRA